MEGPAIRWDAWSIRHARAGRFAEERYRRGLKSYRHRMRGPLLVTVVPMYAFFWGVVFTHKLDTLSVLAAVVASSATVLIVWVRDDPPAHVLHWRRGAEGERRTERALKKLERAGWSVRHDVQREHRANIDHIVRTPNGRYFLLETKNLAGTISYDNGVLTAQQFDDPDEVYRYDHLAGRVLAQSAELSERVRLKSGRRTWVQGVVVVWGQFDQGLVEDSSLIYVAGERLADWLVGQVSER